MNARPTFIATISAHICGEPSDGRWGDGVPGAVVAFVFLGLTYSTDDATAEGGNADCPKWRDRELAPTTATRAVCQAVRRTWHHARAGAPSDPRIPADTAGAPSWVRGPCAMPAAAGDLIPKISGPLKYPWGTGGWVEHPRLINVAKRHRKQPSASKSARQRRICRKFFNTPNIIRVECHRRP